MTLEAMPRPIRGSVLHGRVTTATPFVPAMGKDKEPFERYKLIPWRAERQVAVDIPDAAIGIRI